ncbi:DivIVA domain-containing protein [Micromonospora citrea]|uniref:Cell wall synthesis protein Wag31 n=1 Tax=Micromonospora citrea TaxID=47855 RepID=A0A1C6UCF2_9ACTN|nr:DivIVA domain-containing protein [Micromonospora citrea]SCL51539.1 DivIVA domain-containing protein [Micromonospora citrea]
MASQGQRFRRKALRRGYKVDEVDAFLDRVEATLDGRPVGAPVASQEVHDVVFRVRFNGYDEWQVDLHLDRVERQLAELEERGGAGGRGGDPRMGDRLGPPDRMGPPARDDRGMSPVPQPMPPRPMPAQAGPPPADRYGRYEEPTGAFAGGYDGPRGGYEPARGPGGPGPMGPGAPMGHGGPPPRGLPAGPGAYGDGPGGPGGYGDGPGDPRGGYGDGPGGPGGYGDGPGDPRGGYGDGPGGPGGYGDGPGGPGGYGDPRGGYGDGPGGYGDGPGDPRGGYGDGPGGYGDEPRFDGFEAGRRGRADMTAEIRMSERELRDMRGRGPAGPPPQQGFGGPPPMAGPPMGGPPVGGPPVGGPPLAGPPPTAGPPMAGPPGSDLYRVDQIRRSFQVRRFGSGYDPDQVDRFFDSLLGGMQGRNPMPVNPKELDSLRFPLVPGGYFEAEVDAALKDVQDILFGR